MSRLDGEDQRIITGHKAVRAALRDTSTYSSDLQGDADVRDYRQIPLEVDPPRHHLYRNALGPYFVKPTVEKAIPEFRQHTELLVNQYFSFTGQDVIGGLVLPLVMHNLGVLYGRPQDVAEWISWGPDVWTAESQVRDGRILHSYLDRIHKEAMASSCTDVWQEIAHLEIEGKVITENEFWGIASVMLAGGRDTMVKLLTGMLWHFALKPADLELLRSEPNLISSAIQEFLRFFTPLPQMARTTTRETGADHLPDDRYIGISFISGNFDEDIFENPLEINFKRAKIPHLSFGFGPHTCLGNHIAELEARVFLETLVNSELDWQIESCDINFHASPYGTVPDSFRSLFLSPLTKSEGY